MSEKFLEIKNCGVSISGLGAEPLVGVGGGDPSWGQGDGVPRNK